MNHLANTLTINPTSENLAAARIWADKGLSTVTTARRDRERLVKPEAEMSPQEKETRHMCDQVLGVALFNLGVLQEVRCSRLLCLSRWRLDV